MARCSLCGLEMLTAKGCKCGKVLINGKEIKRIKVGDPGDFFEDGGSGKRCGDCGAEYGYFHHWGCDCERCPSCGGQLLYCDCYNVSFLNKEEVE